MYIHCLVKSSKRWPIFPTQRRVISAWQALETAKAMADAKDADGKAILTLG